MAAETAASGMRIRSVNTSLPEDPLQHGNENGSGDYLGDGQGAPAPVTSPLSMNSAPVVDNSDIFSASGEPVQLPQSTHTLIFTQPVCSLPFIFAVGVVALSYSCLFLAGFNIVEADSSDDNPLNIPANVGR